MKSKIRWGIIGCGDVTERKSGPAFQKANGSSLAAVMRRTGHLAQDYAKRHGVPRWYDDADLLIQDSQVDAVYIATPPGAHLELALKVCAAGKPAYVEKPMARNHRECRLMVEAFAAANVPLFVAYYRRALPRFVKAKQLIDAGRLGQVTGVVYRQAARADNAQGGGLPWRFDATQSGGGLFLDVGSHTLDIIDFFLGQLVDVGGIASNLASLHAVEDSVAMHFRTGNGALGIATWNFASSMRADALQINGTRGQISMSIFENDPVVFDGESAQECFDLPNPPHVHQPLVQTIVDQLSGQGRCPSSGVSAARTSQVMDIVLSDYYAGRDDAFWLRPQTWKA